jgi:hypothetical protein
MLTFVRLQKKLSCYTLGKESELHQNVYTEPDPHNNDAAPQHRFLLGLGRKWSFSLHLHFPQIFGSLYWYTVVGLKRKCIFQFSQKCENHAKMGRFSWNFVLRKCSQNLTKISRQFSRKRKIQSIWQWYGMHGTCGVIFSHNSSF